MMTNQPAASVPVAQHTARARFRAALADATRELAVEKNLKGATDQQIDDQADKTLAAYHRLLDHRAPSLAEAHKKLLIMRDVENGQPSSKAWDSINADMEALVNA